MSLKIEAGKFYRARNGQKVGPIEAYYASDLPWKADGGAKLFHADGKRMGGNWAEWDLVAEWVEGPVRTVTRKEIVPGAYGRVTVFCRDNEYLPIRIMLKGEAFDAAELQSVIATLTEIADALGEAS